MIYRNTKILKALVVTCQSTLFYFSTAFAILVSGVGFLFFEFLFHRDHVRSTTFKGGAIRRTIYALMLGASSVFAISMVLSIMPFLAAYTSVIKVVAFFAFMCRNSLTILSKSGLFVGEDDIAADDRADVMFAIYGLLYLVGVNYQVPFLTNLILNPVVMIISGLVLFCMVYRNFNSDYEHKIRDDGSHSDIDRSSSVRSSGGTYAALFPDARAQRSSVSRDVSEDDFDAVPAIHSSTKCLWPPEQKHYIAHAEETSQLYYS